MIGPQAEIKLGKPRFCRVEPTMLYSIQVWLGKMATLAWGAVQLALLTGDDSRAKTMVDWGGRPLPISAPTTSAPILKKDSRHGP